MDYISYSESAAISKEDSIQIGRMGRVRDRRDFQRKRTKAAITTPMASATASLAEAPAEGKIPN